MKFVRRDYRIETQCGENENLWSRKFYTIFFTIFFFTQLMFFFSCNMNSSNKNEANLEISRLPFIGTKNFETREGVSGAGTPHYVVEIKENCDVEFRFVQINQADRNIITRDTFFAGKYKKTMFCNFDWDDFPRYYQITKDTIYEVDSIGKMLFLDECCGHLETSCACKGELYELY